MLNLRTYGREPFAAAVVHGGPGAPGEMEDVARELSSSAGILEPLQTEDTVRGQVEELRAVLESKGMMPATLIGFSWGAWLSCILAASFPQCVGKLILVSSGPFREEEAAGIMAVRLGRLGEDDRREAEQLLQRLNEFSSTDNASLERFGQLMSKADALDPLPEHGRLLPVSQGLYRKVWSEAARLRSSGQMLRLAKEVRCPVLAIHGDYDPHPAGAIKNLSDVFRDFRFILLEECGHRPWLERHARDKFFEVLKAEV
jgi:pimeloyl-ACP methyl ester carboxylesterase